MKKSIFAVLAVTAISGANAQSSVTLYGTVDEGYLATHNKESTTVPINGTQNKTTNESINTSGIAANNFSKTRFGIKAKEDLGQGNAAGAQLEFGLNPNAASTALETRQAFVYVGNADAGTVSVGKIQTKTYEYLSENDGSGSTVVPGSIYYNHGVQGTPGIFDRANGINYSVGNGTYKLSAGYTGQTKSGEQHGTTSSYGLHGYELAGQVRSGNFFGGGAYLTGDSDYQLDAFKGVANAKAITAFAGYDFGILKTTYTYYQQQFSNYGTPGWTERYHQIGLTAPVTPAVTAFATYVIGQARGKIIDDHNLKNNGSGNGFQLGVKYALSKRTDIYGAYGQQKAHYNIIGGGRETEQAQAYTVGLRHTF